jgi:methionyl-tRNA formyltransferase
MNPWPGAFTTFRDEQVKVWKSRIFGKRISEYSGQGYAAGQILALSEYGLLVAAGSGGILEIIEIQPAGKKKMTAQDFFNGRRVKSGEFFI